MSAALNAGSQIRTTGSSPAVTRHRPSGERPRCLLNPMRQDGVEEQERQSEREQGGRMAEARVILTPVYEGFTEGLDSNDMRKAKTVLRGLGLKL